MITNPLLTIPIPLVADSSRGLPEDERHRRLLQALRDPLPRDATALLRLDGEYLILLAADGLSPGTLGRRLRVGEHPRLEALLERRGPTHFPADCSLSDLYNGLVEGLYGHLEIHDCLGCPLYLDDQSWDLLTLDTLDPLRFASAGLDTLEAFTSLAAAAVKVSEWMRDLTCHAKEERQRVKAYLEAIGEQPRETIGQSAARKALLEEIHLAANSDLSILITGKIGAGKELVAQFTHRHSMCSGKPMISLNCAVLSETLAESELLGHVHGAFSGAVNEWHGKFELADGGSLSLDGVGELPLVVQAKLLHVLQSEQLQRVGSDREHRVDVRPIAATNRDLAEGVRAGCFRVNLYHRLSVYPLCVPPLRERGRDILLPAGYFPEENRPCLGLRSLRLDHEVQAVLLNYRWPGNMRELGHLVGRASLKAPGHNPGRSRIVILHRQDLDLPVEIPAPPRSVVEPVSVAPTTSHSLRAVIDACQRHLIQGCLARHQGSWALAARGLGLGRANLVRLVRRL